MTDKIEESTKRLTELSKSDKLSGDEAKEAREVMVNLRKKGMTSREIEELTDGRWKESTIRGYVKGVKPGDEWKSEASVLRELVSADLTIEDVKQVINLSQQIDVEEISEVINQLKAEGLSLEDLITTYQGLRDQKLTPADIGEVLEYKKDIESLGFSLDSLGVIREEAEKTGSPQKVLKQIAAYKELKELEAQKAKIEEEKQKAEVKLKELKENAESQKKELKELKSKLSEAKQNLEVFRELEENGFTLDVLEKLRKVAKSFDVFKGLEKYKSLRQIENEIKGRREEAEGIKSEILELEREYKEELEVCGNLEELGFDLPALHSLTSMLEGYNKKQAFDAVASYKNLKELDAEISKEKAEVEKLQKKHAHLSEVSELFDSLTEKGIGLRFIEQVQKLSGEHSVGELFKMVEKTKGIKELEAEVERLGKEKLELENEIESLENSYSHLSEQLDFSNTLLEKFGAEGVESLQKLSGKHPPKELFKGLEKYRDLRGLEEELKADKKELDALDEQIKERKALISSQHEEIKKLNKVSVEAGKKLGEIEARIEQSENTAKLLEFIDQPRNFDKEFVAIHVAPVIDALKIWVEEKGEVGYPSLAVSNARDLARAVRD